jgi:hypothetical protein
MLRAAEMLGTVMVPALSRWAGREQQDCAYFAAVALDRRIAHNRDLLLEQMRNPY